VALVTVSWAFVVHLKIDTQDNQTLVALGNHGLHGGA
jgi:hypothetical protein